MRTVDEIQDEMITRIQADPALAGLSSDSKTSVWRLLTWVVAYAIFLHERIVERNAENSRPHTKQWYRDQAFGFMDGLALTWIDGQFKYNTAGMTESQINELKKVHYVAINEAPSGVLVIKTATDGVSGSEPLELEVHERFQSYMELIKDAGNRLNFVNLPADQLQVTLTVYVDDLLIDLDTGELVNEPGVNPVEDACRDYLRNLEFDGAFVKTYFIDHLQKAVGVKIPLLEDLKRQSHTDTMDDVLGKAVVPKSGHFIFDSITVEYKKYEVEGL